MGMMWKINYLANNICITINVRVFKTMYKWTNWDNIESGHRQDILEKKIYV